MAEPGFSPARGADDAVEPPATASIQGANPFVGLNRQQIAAAMARWGGRLAREPMVLASSLAGLTAEQLRVLAGISAVEPDPKDRRFTDPAWKNPVWRRLAQSYLGSRQAVLGTVDDLDLDEKSAERARFALMQVTEALAPTNALVGNPAALKRAANTRGLSLVKGTRNMISDLRHNGGMPSQVDTRPFTVGGNIAISPGAVVYRSEVLELIQYQPTTPAVRERPVMIIPPQVNKFYFLDLAPGRSFIEHAVGQGLTVFTISWRNPTPAQRDWSLDTYVGACLDAAEVACDIAGSDDLNLIGFCAGGITQSLAAGPPGRNGPGARELEHPRRHHDRHRSQELHEHVRDPAQCRVVDRSVASQGDAGGSGSGPRVRLGEAQRSRVELLGLELPAR